MRLAVRTRHSVLVAFALLASLGAVSAHGQQTAAPAGVSVAVIDVQRLVTDSQAGKEVLANLKQKSEQKSAELKILADELDGLRQQINEGRLSLSEDRLSDLQRQLEDKTIAFRRARDDAERELQEFQGKRFAEIERRVMPIINAVGVEGGYTLIFNKFESGLVFAQQSVDITDEILRRFDASRAEESGGAEGGR